MKTVPRENLIGPLTAQQDFDFGTPLAADQVGTDGSRIGNRLVQVPHDLRQKVYNIGVDLNFVVIGSQPTGSHPGENFVRVGLLECSVLGAVRNGIRLDRPVREYGRERKNGAGVEPPAQKDTNRDVAD